MAKPLQLQVQTSYSQILKLALPISAAILVPQLNYIINNIFLGTVSNTVLAAAGITGVYYLVFAVLGIGLNNGLQALISRRAGEGNVSAIGILVNQAFVISIVLGIVGVLFTWLVAPTLFSFFMHDKSLINLCINFLHIRIFGLFFLYLYQMRNALLVGMNLSKYLVIGTASEAVSNVLLDYMLIKGGFGCTALGFEGAAYASIAAECIGLLVIFLVLRFKKIDKQLGLFSNFSVHWPTIKIILKQSLPLIAQHAISIITWNYFYFMVEHHGQLTLSISNTMRNIFGFFGCFTWAFASATNSMVSNIIGQQKQHEVFPLIHKILRLSIGFSLSVCVLLNLFPEAFLQVYSQGPQFVNEAIPVVRVVSVAMMIMSFSVVWFNAMIGSGNSTMALYCEIVSITFYSIYVYIVLEKLNLNITWGWASEWIYWLVMCLPSWWYMKKANWLKKI